MTNLIFANWCGGKFAKATFFHPENVLENSDKWLALQDKVFTR